ncbi:hypothetical protein [Psychrobacter faecalis]|uniref:hypothetical protein n=1 Tax=Psychrobacter faecalis TaxID=180588 RepID=UPI001866F95F|nr:hypothetical protein [Psychrobacter faecalis]
MERIFDATVAKEITEASSNEDASDYDYQKNIFALSDGASESYNSKNWARILVNEFVDCPNLSEQWLIHCIHQYIAKLDLSSLTESQYIAFNKGSFATLIGVQRQSNKINILNVGDSHIFVFTKENIKTTNTKSLKYIELFDKPVFKDNPTLISTKLQNNDFIDFNDIEHSKYFKVLDLANLPNSYNLIYDEILSTQHEVSHNQHIFLPIKKEVYLVCATDAVAEWLFRHIDNNKTEKIFNFLLSLKEDKNKGKFERTVTLCRSWKSMNVDDSTLAILKCEYDYGLS